MPDVELSESCLIGMTKKYSYRDGEATCEAASNHAAALEEEGRISEAMSLYRSDAMRGSPSSLSSFNWHCLFTGEYQAAREVFDSSIQTCREFVDDWKRHAPHHEYTELLQEELANAISNDALVRLAAGASHEEVRKIWNSLSWADHSEAHFYPSVLTYLSGNISEAITQVSNLDEFDVVDLQETLSELLDDAADDSWIYGWGKTCKELFEKELTPTGKLKFANAQLPNLSNRDLSYFRENLGCGRVGERVAASFWAYDLVTSAGKQWLVIITNLRVLAFKEGKGLLPPEHLIIDRDEIEDDTIGWGRSEHEEQQGFVLSYDNYVSFTFNLTDGREISRHLHIGSKEEDVQSGLVRAKAIKEALEDFDYELVPGPTWNSRGGFRFGIGFVFD